MIEELKRTRENWTYGIINIPLLYGHNNRLGVNPRSILRKVAHNAKCYHTPFPVLDKRYRYLWFELDTTEYSQHLAVLYFFKLNHIDVYWHRTSKGFHYITMYLLPKEKYDITITYLKNQYGNLTFSYSLRIIPNKWIGEMSPMIWYMGDIVNNSNNRKTIEQLQYVRHAINQPYVFNYNRTIPNTVQLLDNMFCISRYEFKKALQT